jgi:hypothetical protein
MSGDEWIPVSERLPPCVDGYHRSDPVITLSKYSRWPQIDHALFIPGETHGFTGGIRFIKRR